MAQHTSPVHHVPYHLVCFGPDGVERKEPTGELASDSLVDSAAIADVTDVFVFSHGWNGDLTDAKRQYGRWLDAMAECVADRERLEGRARGFTPLLIGLHWPSKPWGDEPLGGNASFSVTAQDFKPTPEPIDQLVDEYASVLGDHPAIKSAIMRIVEVAKRDPIPASLPAVARDAYDDLNRHLEIRAEGDGAAPGDDREIFDPEQMYQAILMAEAAEPVAYGGFSLGGILGPLRYLSFWTMKKRAMLFGQSGAADLLTRLRTALPSARLHLAGHSFGCIVTSAAVAGPPETAFDGPRAESLVLIQGAMSLWSFCDRIPSRPDRDGYFRRVIGDRLVNGPILTTTSVHDKAVRILYPLAASILGQVAFGPGGLPAYGGVGTFGIQGPGIDIVDLDLQDPDADYHFQPNVAYNLNANGVISTMKGVSGAHSDICHPQVAHAVFRAADAS
ncbi:hypothetical protein [Mycolicibacterium peregrinum]|uniref:hypothetical protein n=1 Tax=Mycolicibacterium peregrinum TaxID=43304 RepID=UPI003AAAE9CD